MATASMVRRRTPIREVGGTFYLLISLVMAAVFIGGFSQTVPDDFPGTPALPLLLHAHGAIFTTWVLLFVAQPAFIARGSLELHRRIGWIGAWLAAAMVVMGVTATLVSIHDRRVPAVFPPGVFLVMNIVGIAVFGALIVAGLRLRHRREWHKRLMLCATISILGPGLGRLLPLGHLPLPPPLTMLLCTLAFVAAGMIADLAARRRVHPAYFWGLTAIVATNALIAALGFTAPVLAAVASIEAGV